MRIFAFYLSFFIFLQFPIAFLAILCYYKNTKLDVYSRLANLEPLGWFRVDHTVAISLRHLCLWNKIIILSFLAKTPDFGRVFWFFHSAKKRR